MEMQLPSTFGSMLSQGDFLSSLPGIRRRQLSRLNAYAKGNRFNAKENRKLRKAEYKAKMAYANMPEKVRDAMKENPLQYGLPRRFKVLVAGQDATSTCKVHDEQSYHEENHFIHFAAFGIPGKPVQFNNIWITPGGNEISLDKRGYSLCFPESDGSKIYIYLDFTIIDRPTGILETSAGQYALRLLPYAMYFDVSVASNTGAYVSTNGQDLTWDDTTSKWKNADWESNAMVFGYDTAVVHDPTLGILLYNEVSYQDNDDPTSIYEFDKDVYGTNYTAVANGMVEYGATFFDVQISEVVDVPDVSVQRAQDEKGVLSVFPNHSTWKFDELGVNFTGAYTVADSDTVYGVIGTAQGLDLSPPGPQVPSQEQPVQNGTPTVFTSSVRPTPHIVPTVNGPTPKPVTGLLNFDPMKPDSTDPSGFTDIISQTANEDFHDIICYWMDPAIHNLFISTTPTHLDADVYAIATDDDVNKTFYQTLQVPYITTSLAFAPDFKPGAQCNGVRASAQLRSLPTNGPHSEVYSRHSDALYKLRYKQQFPGIKDYLDDQAGVTGNDWTSTIESMSTSMQTKIKATSSQVNDPDGSNLQSALQDIQDLEAWAKAQKLFYAFQLYSYAGTYFLPSLASQMASAKLSSSVSRSIKKISTTLGILENSQQNPNGKSFQEAFNNLMRFYMMTSQIPQFVDCDGNSSDFDSIMKTVLNEFYKENKDSSDPDIAKQAELAEELAGNDAAIHGSMTNLALAMRTAGALGSWVSVVKTYNSINANSPWYKNLGFKAADSGATLMRAVCVTMLISTMFTGGGWKNMTDAQRFVWTTTGSALFLTLTIKGIQGIIRANYIWTDTGSLGDSLKAFLGFDKLVANAAEAADATAGTFSKWLVRTGPENMELAGDEINWAMKAFGRSAGEFLANCVGAILAGVNIVMSIIDAVKTNSTTEKIMDSMMIASSALQLLAIGAGWLVSAELVTNMWTVAILQSVGAFLGPLSIAFAIVGAIVLIAMIFLKKKPDNDPVQQFINNQVAAAGLKKDHNSCIDEFNIVPSDSNNGSLNGISIKPASLNSLVLQLYEDSGSIAASKFSVGFGSNVTYLSDTCWSVQTDSLGQTMIFTSYVDSTGTKTSLCLGESADGSISVVPTPQQVTLAPDGTLVQTDPAVYNAEMALLQWRLDILADAAQVQRTVQDKPETYSIQAQMSITRSGPNGKTLYAVQQADGSYNLQLSAATPSGNHTSRWILNMETMIPSTFSYIQENWTLVLNDKDENNFVMFADTTSLPLSWSITPSLPPFLRMADPAINPGAIEQLPGVVPSLMSIQNYTVTASINVLSKIYSQSAQVAITVIDSTVPPPTPTTEETHEASMLSAPQEHKKLHPQEAKPQTNGQVLENMSTSGKIPACEGFEQPSQLLSASAITDTVEQAYEKMMASAPAFFKWQPSSAMDMNQHWTASSAMAKMQNSVSGTWKPQISESHGFEGIYFPKPPVIPFMGNNDHTNYTTIANAFVAMAIYNGNAHVQGSCDINSIQNCINNFNQQLWSTNTDRYIDWLQWFGSYLITGGTCSYDQYRLCITNSDWLAMKSAQQSDPSGWENQSLEMFHHFLKLSSIGATVDQISDIFTTITTDTTKPVLNPAGFPDITPSTWPNYRGYIFNKGVNYSQLQVQNLNEKSLVPAGNGTVISAYADSSFIHQAGYQKPAPSGCCFQQTTRVVLEDGTDVSISEIEPGHSIRSFSPNGDDTSVVVRWVSRPMQNGRCLYSYKTSPEIMFTSTHPIYFGEEDGSPLLAFVDIQAALSVNPLWAAFALRQLAKEDLIEYQAQAIDQQLFDLVFDTAPSNSKNVSMPIYMVKTASGEQFNVCSEAPDMTMLPACTRFMLSFANAIGQRPDLKSFFPEGLRMGVLDYATRIRKYRNKCADDAILIDTDITQPLTMESFLSIQSEIDTQTLADSIEAVTGALGLGLQAQLNDGWQYIPSDASGSDSSGSTDIITIHFLQLVQSDILDIPKPFAPLHADLVTIIRKSLQNEPDISALITAGTEGPQTASTLTSSHLTLTSLGPYLHQCRCSIPVPDLEESNSITSSSSSLLSTSPTYTISMTVNSIELTATGTVSPDIEVKWPVYLSPHNNKAVFQDPSVLSYHIGWLSLTYGTVTGEQWERASSWATIATSSMLSPMERYGELLGQAVGEDILKSIYGQ